jgi:hypothetical protein
MASWFGRGGTTGGGAPATPNASRNYVVNDDTELATLPSLLSGDTVRIKSSGAAAESKWWQILTPGLFSAATKLELETKEATSDSLTVVGVADESARLALVDQYNPFRIVKELSTSWAWMQVRNPSSDPNSWVVISKAETTRVTDVTIDVTDGGIMVTNTTGDA